MNAELATSSRASAAQVSESARSIIESQNRIQRSTSAVGSEAERSGGRVSTAAKAMASSVSDAARRIMTDLGSTSASSKDLADEATRTGTRVSDAAAGMSGSVSAMAASVSSDFEKVKTTNEEMADKAQSSSVVFTDAQGRMRNELGQFVSAAEAAKRKNDELSDSNTRAAESNRGIIDKLKERVTLTISLTREQDKQVARTAALTEQDRRLASSSLQAAAGLDSEAGATQKLAAAQQRLNDSRAMALASATYIQDMRNQQAAIEQTATVMETAAASQVASMDLIRRQMSDVERSYGFLAATSRESANQQTRDIEALAEAHSLQTAIILAENEKLIASNEKVAVSRAAADRGVSENQVKRDWADTARGINSSAQDIKGVIDDPQWQKLMNQRRAYQDLSVQEDAYFQAAHRHYAAIADDEIRATKLTKDLADAIERKNKLEAEIPPMRNVLKHNLSEAQSNQTMKTFGPFTGLVNKITNGGIIDPASAREFERRKKDLEDFNKLAKSGMDEAKAQEEALQALKRSGLIGDIGNINTLSQKRLEEHNKELKRIEDERQARIKAMTQLPDLLLAGGVPAQKNGGFMNTARYGLGPGGPIAVGAAGGLLGAAIPPLAFAGGAAAGGYMALRSFPGQEATNQLTTVGGLTPQQSTALDSQIQKWSKLYGVDNTESTQAATGLLESGMPLNLLYAYMQRGMMAAGSTRAKIGDVMNAVEPMYGAYGANNTKDVKAQMDMLFGGLAGDFTKNAPLTTLFPEAARNNVAFPELMAMFNRDASTGKSVSQSVTGIDALISAIVAGRSNRQQLAAARSLGLDPGSVFGDNIQGMGGMGAIMERIRQAAGGSVGSIDQIMQRTGETRSQARITQERQFSSNQNVARLFGNNQAAVTQAFTLAYPSAAGVTFKDDIATSRSDAQGRGTIGDAFASHASSPYATLDQGIAKIKSMSKDIGTMFTPIMAGIISKLGEFGDWIDSHKDVFKPIIDGLKALGAQLQNFGRWVSEATHVEALKIFWQTLLSASATVGSFFKSFGNEIRNAGPVFDRFVGNIHSGLTLFQTDSKNSGGAAKILADLFLAAMAVIGSAIGTELTIISLLVKTVLGLVGWFKQLADMLHITALAGDGFNAKGGAMYDILGKIGAVLLAGVAAWKIYGATMGLTGGILRDLRALFVGVTVEEKLMIVATNDGKLAVESQAASTKGLAIATRIQTAATTEGTIANRLLTASMLGIPIVAIVAGLIALGVALVVLYKNWDGFRHVVDATFSFVKGLITGFIGFVKNNFSDVLILMFTGPLGPIIVLWEHFHSQITGAVGALVKNVLSGIGGMFKSLGDGINGAINALISILPGWMQGIAKIFAGLPQQIIDQIGSLKDKFLGWIQDNIGTWIDGGKKIGDSIAQGLLQALPGFMKQLGVWKDDFINWVGGMTAGQRGPQGATAPGPYNSGTTYGNFGPVTANRYEAGSASMLRSLAGTTSGTIMDTDFAGKNQNIVLPGNRSQVYTFLGEGNTPGIGGYEVWQTPNGGKMMFLHTSQNFDIVTGVGKGFSVSGAPPVGYQVGGGTVVGVSGAPTGTAAELAKYGNTAGAYHLCVVTDAQGRDMTQWLTTAQMKQIQAGGATPFANQNGNIGSVGLDPLTKNGKLAGYPVNPKAPYTSAQNPAIVNAANKTGLPPWLIASLVTQESSGDPNAVSHPSPGRSDIGLTQTSTLAASAVNMPYTYNPQQNVLTGSTYLEKMIKSHGGDIRTGLAYYNPLSNGQPNWAYADDVLSHSAIGRGLTTAKGATQNLGSNYGYSGTSTLPFVGGKQSGVPPLPNMNFTPSPLPNPFTNGIGAPRSRYAVQQYLATPFEKPIDPWWYTHKEWVPGTTGTSGMGHEGANTATPGHWIDRVVAPQGPRPTNQFNLGLGQFSTSRSAATKSPDHPVYTTESGAMAGWTHIGQTDIPNLQKAIAGLAPEAQKALNPLIDKLAVKWEYVGTHVNTEQQKYYNTYLGKLQTDQSNYDEKTRQTLANANIRLGSAQEKHVIALDRIYNNASAQQARAAETNRHILADANIRQSASNEAYLSRQAVIASRGGEGMSIAVANLQRHFHDHNTNFRAMLEESLRHQGQNQAIAQDKQRAIQQELIHGYGISAINTRALLQENLAHQAYQNSQKTKADWDNYQSHLKGLAQWKIDHINALHTQLLAVQAAIAKASTPEQKYKDEGAHLQHVITHNTDLGLGYLRYPETQKYNDRVGGPDDRNIGNHLDDVVARVADASQKLKDRTEQQAEFAYLVAVKMGDLAGQVSYLQGKINKLSQENLDRLNLAVLTGTGDLVALTQAVYNDEQATLKRTNSADIARTTVDALNGNFNALSSDLGKMSTIITTQVLQDLMQGHGLNQEYLDGMRKLRDVQLTMTQVTSGLDAVMAASEGDLAGMGSAVNSLVGVSFARWEEALHNGAGVQNQYSTEMIKETNALRLIQIAQLANDYAIGQMTGDVTKVNSALQGFQSMANSALDLFITNIGRIDTLIPKATTSLDALSDKAIGAALNLGTLDDIIAGLNAVTDKNRQAAEKEYATTGTISPSTMAAYANAGGAANGATWDKVGADLQLEKGTKDITAYYKTLGDEITLETNRVANLAVTQGVDSQAYKDQVQILNNMKQQYAGLGFAIDRATNGTILNADQDKLATWAVQQFNTAGISPAEEALKGMTTIITQTGIDVAQANKDAASATQSLGTEALNAATSIQDMLVPIAKLVSIINGINNVTGAPVTVTGAPVTVTGGSGAAPTANTTMNGSPTQTTAAGLLIGPNGELITNPSSVITHPATGGALGGPAPGTTTQANAYNMGMNDRRIGATRTVFPPGTDPSIVQAYNNGYNETLPATGDHWIPNAGGAASSGGTQSGGTVASGGSQTTTATGGGSANTPPVAYIPPSNVNASLGQNPFANTGGISGGGGISPFAPPTTTAPPPSGISGGSSGGYSGPMPIGDPRGPAAVLAQANAIVQFTSLMDKNAGPAQLKAAATQIQASTNIDAATKIMMQVGVEGGKNQRQMIESAKVQIQAEMDVIQANYANASSNQAASNTMLTAAASFSNSVTQFGAIASGKSSIAGTATATAAGATAITGQGFTYGGGNLSLDPRANKATYTKQLALYISQGYAPDVASKMALADAMVGFFANESMGQGINGKLSFDPRAAANAFANSVPGVVVGSRNNGNGYIVNYDINGNPVVPGMSTEQAASYTAAGLNTNYNAYMGLLTGAGPLGTTGTPLVQQNMSSWFANGGAAGLSATGNAGKNVPIGPGMFATVPMNGSATPGSDGYYTIYDSAGKIVDPSTLPGYNWFGGVAGSAVATVRGGNLAPYAYSSAMGAQYMPGQYSTYTPPAYSSAPPSSDTSYGTFLNTIHPIQVPIGSGGQPSSSGLLSFLNGQAAQGFDTGYGTAGGTSSGTSGSSGGTSGSSGGYQSDPMYIKLKAMLDALNAIESNTAASADNTASLQDIKTWLHSLSEIERGSATRQIGGATDWGHWFDNIGIAGVGMLGSGAT